MIVIPELRGDEDFFPPNGARFEHFPHRVSHRFFIAVSFRTIEMAKSHLQGGLGRLFGCAGSRNERAVPDGRNRTGAVSEGDLGKAQCIGACHTYAPRL